jgi:CHAT domain
VRVLTWVAGLLCLCGVVDGPRAVTQPACDAASASHDWAAVLAACGPDTADGAQPRGRMRHAWAQFYRGRHEEALVEGAALFDSSERAEARYLGGLLLAKQADRIEEGRRLLGDALGLFAAAADARRVTDTASALVSVALDQRRFDDALAFARMAVRFASATSDPGRRGSALMTLAVAYDVIGRAEDARAAFRAAAEILATRPAELAWVYFKHAIFLLELQTHADAGAALDFLDAAARNANRAVRIGQAERVAGLDVAIPFNRAAALSTLGRDDEALASLAALPSTERGHAMFQMITGIAAARRGDTDVALAHLDRPLADGVSGDYAVSVEVELAHVCRAKGHFVDAERALRRAIEHVESLRVQGSLELRPWILAHRASPYEALIELLVEQDRAADALAVIESLHARAWLDATTTTVVAEPAVPVDPASVQPRSPAATAPLDRAVLLERLGDREALVFLDLGPTAWRAHVVGGVVRIEPVPAAAFAALAAFRSAPDRLAAAAAAAAILLPPELTADDHPLTIVASGRFADLPFPALRRGSRLLIDDRAIARLPGLAALRCQIHAAGGAPVFIGDAAGDLPYAAAEVRALAAAYHVPARLGAAVTRAAVLASRDAAWLHLAVHGEVGPDGGALSLGDGAFAAASVLREHLAPDVVVLAGCSTATGADVESWSGFPSAFLAAGSRFVIATTRSVVDDAAAAVMQTFYAQPAALDPIARLAAAQRAIAARVPATAWASFAAWGVSGCDVDAVLPGG